MCTHNLFKFPPEKCPYICAMCLWEKKINNDICFKPKFDICAVYVSCEKL